MVLNQILPRNIRDDEKRRNEVCSGLLWGGLAALTASFCFGLLWLLWLLWKFSKSDEGGSKKDGQSGFIWIEVEKCEGCKVSELVNYCP